MPLSTELAATTRVDRDVVSRFATCCRALGLSVHDRQRPADLAAARSGFTALTHVAHDQCDAWTGLAAAGDSVATVIESVWRTSATAGVLQRQIELAPGALGFTYDTGLYLQFRATDPDDFQLAYAATLSDAAEYAGADRLVGELIERRPGWLEARWLRVAICYRTERWSDVVRLLTPVVNDASLDETVRARRPRDAGHRAGQARHVRPRAVASGGTRRPGRRGGRRRRAREGAHPAGARARTRTPTTCCRTCTPPTRRTRRSKRRCRIRRSAWSPPPPPGSRRAPSRGIRTPNRTKPTSSTPAPRNARRTC